MRVGLLRSAVALALALGLVAAVVQPAPADQDVVVSPTPDPKHPRILDGRVYGIASRGPKVLVAGTFTTIRNGAFGTRQIRQPRLFRFDSDTGLIDKTFRPRINGDVEAVTYADGGTSILVAGSFTRVNGKVANRIAKLHLNGTLDRSFKASAARRVKDFALTGGRLILGGEFNKINGRDVQRLAAINPRTGALDRTFRIQATGSRDRFAPYVQDLDVSPDGRWLVIGGNFTRVGGKERHQVAVINLGGDRPRVSQWSTGRYRGDCAVSYKDTYIRGIDISPDSRFFVVNTTGAFIGFDLMCDSSARWELPPKGGRGAQPTWVNHTGGDTYWAVEITESAVYVGGHMRWSNNSRPTPRGNSDGPGSVSRPGIAALDPYSGVPLSWNPGRDRGRGVEAMHATDDYLMVGSDTAYFAGKLRQRLAMLPVTGGTVNPRPRDVDLPVRLFFTTDDRLSAVSFDGRDLGDPLIVSGPDIDGIDWTDNRDGFVQDGRLSYFGSAQAFYSRPFDASTVGTTELNLSTTVGYLDADANRTPYDQPYGVAQTRTAAFDGGRVLYTRTDSRHLHYRGYSLESGILGSLERTASGKDWRGARSLELIDNWLYAAWSDNKLYRFWAPDGLPRWTSRAVVDDGDTSGVPWAQMNGMWATSVSGTAHPPSPPG